MKSVDAADRGAVEAFYTEAEFRRDAARNTDPQAQIHYGLRIFADPEGKGRPRLTPAQRHVAEAAPDPDAIFLSPFRDDVGVSDRGSAYGIDSQEARDPLAAAEAYRDFIVRVVEAARSAKFPPPIGLHEDRLKGFRGG